MRRRDALRNCAVLGATGGLAGLAGCSGGADDSETESADSASLSKEGFDYREGDDGNLVVAVTIANSGHAEGTGYLYVTVTAAPPAPGTETENETGSEAAGDGTEGEDGGDDDAGGDQSDGAGDESDGDGTVASRQSREVTVPAGETKTVEIPFEFTVEQFRRRGSIDVDFRP